MAAYYNEFDPKAAAWLRELIKQGHIADGEVDGRSIVDVRPDDLRGFTQCHFFAGIGVWSYALRKAGWADDRPVWTGSCPCPPFSSAGKGQQCPSCGSKRNLCHPRKTGHFICLDCGCDRHADSRHLWPEFSRLIGQCKPSVVFGEQVASKDGRYWLDAVSADLWLMGYGVGSADICAAGVGAPHIRQRLWWVGERLGDTNGRQRGGVADGTGCRTDRTPTGWQQSDGEPECVGRSDRLADAESSRGRSDLGAIRSGAAKGLRKTKGQDIWRPGQQAGRLGDSIAVGWPGPTNGLWANADWLFCRDGKWRPVEPGTFPLAHGAAERVGRLRGYGNAIVAPAAQAFIEAYCEVRAA